MAVVRLLLVALLSLAGDFVAPSIPEAMDGIEESEEVLGHARVRRPRLLVLAAASPAPVVTVPPAPVVARARAPSTAGSAPAHLTRKSPSPAADPAAPSEDH